MLGLRLLLLRSAEASNCLLLFKGNTFTNIRIKMKKKTLILLLFCFWMGLSIAQTTTTVCPGSRGTYEVNSPVAGSSYTWALKNGSGTLSSTTGTSITIVWDKASTAADQITVIETNNAGCSGEPSVIEVNKYSLPTAVFEKTSGCNGETPVVKLTGQGHFLFWWNAPGSTMENGADTYMATYPLAATTAGVYQLIRVSDGNCTAIISPGTSQTAFTLGSPLGKLTVKITPQ